MASSNIPSASGPGEDTGPAARDEDPFDDDTVTSILDAAWEDIES